MMTLRRSMISDQRAALVLPAPCSTLFLGATKETESHPLAYAV
jgi:hypothetical protein